MFKDFRSTLTEEFFTLFRSPPVVPRGDTDAIVVLSHDGGRTIENVIRIEYAALVHRMLSSWRGSGPLFVLNGTVEQLGPMKAMAVEQGIHTPGLLNCGTIETGNTLTQVIAIKEEQYLSRCKSVLVVSSAYHVPRLRRTLSRHLPPSIEYAVTGAPGDCYTYNGIQMMSGEIDRIVRYAERGDIDTVPRF
mgnify:CR=1 FL=1